VTEPKPRDPRPAAAEPAMALDVADRDWAEELAWHDTLGQAAVPPDEAELATAGPDPDCGPPEGWGWDQLRELEVLPRSWTAGFAGGGVLDGMAPDPVLARFAWDACEAGIEALSDDELVGLLLASRKLESQHAAVELAAVAELDRRRMAAAARPGSSRASEHVAEELAAALVPSPSPGQAGTRLDAYATRTWRPRLDAPPRPQLYHAARPLPGLTFPGLSITCRLRLAQRHADRLLGRGPGGHHRTAGQPACRLVLMSHIDGRPHHRWMGPDRLCRRRCSLVR
jgi:hypothetical protein